MSAGAFRKPQAVAGVAGRSRRKMLVPSRRVWKHLLAPFDIMRETAAGEHDALSGANADLASLAGDNGAGYRAVLDRHPAYRRGQPHRNLKTLSRLCQSPAERIAVGQRHATAIAQRIQQMPRQALCDIDSPIQRLRRAHEMDDGLAGS